MKIYGRILNLGVVDEGGEMFSKDCIFSYGRPIPVRDSAKEGLDGIEGEATIEYMGDHLMAELDIRDDSASAKLMIAIRDKQLPMRIYPAVNGFVVSKEGNVINNVRICSIDLCVAGNSDRTIPPLTLTVGEQDQD